MRQTPDRASTTPQNSSRVELMRACSRANDSELAEAVAMFGSAASASDLRRPETGLVMVRGRIGGIGNAFNVGEAVVTRASVQLSDGAVGHSYLLGGSLSRARLAAIVDALGQGAAHRARLDEIFVARVMARVESEEIRQREEAAATRVDFFTLVRGEDQ